MDFYVDLAIAVLLRLLKDRREIRKYRSAIVKVAAAIQIAFADDEQFAQQVEQKVKGS